MTHNAGVVVVGPLVSCHASASMTLWRMHGLEGAVVAQWHCADKQSRCCVGVLQCHVHTRGGLNDWGEGSGEVGTCWGGIRPRQLQTRTGDSNSPMGMASHCTVSLFVKKNALHCLFHRFF